MKHAVESDARQGGLKAFPVHDVCFNDPQGVRTRRAGPHLVEVVQRASGHGHPVDIHPLSEEELAQM
jgi:hypothetical protein